MKKADQITGILLLTFSIYIIITSISLELWWGDEGPGSGFVPFWIGILLALCSIILILSSFKTDYKQEKVFTKEGYKYLFSIIIPSIIAVIVANFLGMIITMGILGSFLVAILSEKRKILNTVGIAVALPVVFYLIFVVALDVPFPKGILGI